MRARDVPALVDLWVASWRETLPAIDFEQRRDWITQFLSVPKHATLVADIGATPAGFVTLEGGHLHQLVVAPIAKGGGVAGRLLDAAKAATAGGLTLDVNQANARAIRFYEREGFRRVGESVNPASRLATWAMRWP